MTMVFNRPTLRLAGLAIAIASLVSACEMNGEDRRQVSDGPHTVFDTIGDTVVARTFGTGGGATAHLEEVWSIGVVDGPPEYTFGSVGLIASGRDGWLYVLDALQRELRQYDTEGRFVRRIGGSGEGPGEYREPTGVAVLADESVAVWDSRLRRLTRYGRDGTFLGQVRLDTRANRWDMLFADSSGHFLLRQWSNGRDMVARYSADGVVLDTLVVPEFNYTPPELDIENCTTHPPFTPSVQWAPTRSGGIVAGLGMEFRLLVTRSGEGVLVIEKEAEPVPVVAEERTEHEARVVWANRLCYPNWVWKGAATPEFKPFFRDIKVGADGRIWVALHSPAAPADNRSEARGPNEGPPPLTWKEPVRFDVFKPDGGFLGTVEFPEGTTRVAEMRGDTVWAVSTDDLGVQSIQRYHVAWPE